ncbi:hypothetical protein ACTWPB_17940 [Nocardia sp. IBHARD005]|uniref:hypothetical protein n=1 Tax=Nocardia sp. IBHARD005 TaxID=3457765 RepID=UPI0040590C92
MKIDTHRRHRTRIAQAIIGSAAAIIVGSGVVMSAGGSATGQPQITLSQWDTGSSTLGFTSPDAAKAERIVLDYVVGAATVDYRDMPAWAARMKHNTVPELAEYLDSTVEKLHGVIGPLKLVSTAKPVLAKARSGAAGVYTVDAIIDVTTTTTRDPAGSTSAVTYVVSIDPARDWKVTAFGGTGGDR